MRFFEELDNGQARALVDLEQLYEVLRQMEAAPTGQEQKLASLRARLAILAKVAAVYQVGHVPNQVANVCIELDRAGLLDSSVTIGTHAMHVYEALAGIRFDKAILPRSSRDLRVATAVPLPRRLAARVDAVRGLQVWQGEPDAFFDEHQAEPDLAWLVRAPRVVHMAVALDGRPFRMVAPDPRAFARFKLWQGTEAPGRSVAQRQRDLAQALALLDLIEERLPHLPRPG